MLATRALALFAFVGLTTVLACGSDETPSTGASKACVPGQEIACACPDGRAGSQRCSTDGASYEACRCTAAGGAAGGGGKAQAGTAGQSGKGGSIVGGSGGSAGGTGGASAGAAGTNAGAAGSSAGVAGTSAGAAGSGTGTGGAAGNAGSPTAMAGSAGTAGTSAGSAGANGGSAGTAGSNAGGAGSAGTSAGSAGAAGSGGQAPLCGTVPSTFKCPSTVPAALVVEPGADCTTAAIATFMADCFGPLATAATCAPHVDAPTACDTCLGKWTEDSSAPGVSCQLHAIEKLNDPACGLALACVATCYDTVCSDELCDSNAKDQSGQTEQDRCFNAQCAPVGEPDPNPKALACTKNPLITTELKICRRSSTKDIELFLRGACRDGGDWTDPAKP